MAVVKRVAGVGDESDDAFRSTWVTYLDTTPEIESGPRLVTQKNSRLPVVKRVAG